ncbi:MAG: Isocitrate dehydrogenase [NADP] [Chlamydiales bacterium]|nr:Isocitrate dehydrogenase [NADP] [Chlamydiales bacterium]MCH9619237.1 Isocitrate dehydrogenase [NADP] [Chlamydiales bacterium]MCH9622499.1 Isocitrate dehydrogenase [NADP] [Chlamydiales bacterium]
MDHPITVAEGDGIGPEIMQATLHILKEAGAALEIEKIDIGEKLYLSGHPTGIKESDFESLRRTEVFLKAPITTPQGGGFRSLNVTIRTAFGLYANVRPCLSYHPFIPTKHPKMDVVIVRENEEDLYTGIEYRQSPDVCHAIKMISRPASERIIRYAFEYALRNNRKKVSCFTKDNILKMSDGLFHQVYEEISQEYPTIESEHWIVDIGTAKIADTPEQFDVVVLPNLYGDIISDVTAQITGSVGLVGTANIGEKGAMFEAIHGSAPKMAGNDSANPSALILASVLMLLHIDQPEVATRIHNGWLKTIEEGIHTKDLGPNSVGTQEFAKQIVSRLGQKPDTLPATSYGAKKEEPWPHHRSKTTETKRELVGVDVYLHSHTSVQTLSDQLKTLSLPLTLITNRGMQVWPKHQPETFCIDQYRCRFEAAHPIDQSKILLLLKQLAQFDVIRTENLYTFGGKPGYSHVERKG